MPNKQFTIVVNVAIFLFLYALSIHTFSQNVGINATGAVPSGDAGLDVNFIDKGVLIPRVSLSNTGTYGLTGGGPTTSMLVYNTNTGIAGTGAAGEGYYYWNGARWTKLLAGNTLSDAWLALGNAGTNPANQFIGTTDNVDLVLRTNNLERIRVTNNGNVGVNESFPYFKLEVYDPTNWGGVRVRGSQNVQFILEAPSNNMAQFGYSQSGIPRFTTSVIGNGDYWSVNRFNNAGTVLDSPLSVNRNSGNVGIHTAYPLSPLHIVSSQANVIILERNSAQNSHIQYSNTNGTMYAGLNSSVDWCIGPNINLDSNPYLTVQNGTGNVGIWTTTPTYKLQLSLDQAAKPSTNTWTVISDKRLKKITGVYTKGLKEILELNPIKYYYIKPENDTINEWKEEVLNKENVGFIAQEVAKIFPECVDSLYSGYLGLNIHSILVAYVNAIKELHATDIELQSKISELSVLKSELATLRKEIDEMKRYLKDDRKEASKDMTLNN